jgi:hypothetical protein
LRFTICGIVFAVAATVSVTIAPAGVVANILIITLAMVAVVWRRPQIVLYVVCAGVCVCELNPTMYPDLLTNIPFFWNVNTIVQVYLHKDFKAIPLNPLELLLIIAAICAGLRSVAAKDSRPRAGILFRPIFIYSCFVGMGWVNGMLTGGDFKISLMEVRPQFYFLIAYLMVVNIVRERKQLDTLLWTMVICIAVKGALYTFRRYILLAGQPLPDQGVGTHDEAFFFDAFIGLLMVLSLFREHKRLRCMMWALLPFVVAGNLATNRRAGTAALLIVTPILFMAADLALPHLRKRIRVIGLILIVGFTVYYYSFKNSTSMYAQPARAIASEFEPSARDASSNDYRDAENADLMATIKLAPIQGYGYGKRMLHVAPMADISNVYEYWDIMTHNSVLWVWMRVGTIGFVFFWIMVCAVITTACRTVRDKNNDSYAKAMGAFALLLISMLLVFGLLDLQLADFRDMLFSGFWIGLLAAVPAIADNHQEKKEITP